VIGRPLTHGMTRTRTYKSWTAMKSRCYYKNNIAYHMYGGAGIKVCDRWLGKNGFSAWWDQKPKAKKKP
jgi:hypothetical protein